ncbi:MAG TPA: sigma-70 family RNA polymerase sigma factor [Leucothrix mucor]|nr:sigma-70 family RNA polymerase sigma factor [Leucothrix mucor]
MQKIEQAWQAYRKNILSFIRSQVSSNEDAEDILNDVFAKLIRVTNDNRIPDNIASWLYRVSKNSIVDYYRSRKKFAELPENISENKEAENIIKELGKCLLPMIMDLPEKYQLVVLLSEIEEKKHKEVALELGLSLSATKSRVLRGREKLHASLLHCCTFHHNNTAMIVDYEKKSPDSCGGC